MPKKLAREYRRCRESECLPGGGFVDLSKKILDLLAPCRKCGETALFSLADPKIETLYSSYFVICGRCGYEGPIADDICCAFSAWGLKGAED